MSGSRPAAVAGTFYPDDPPRLRATIERCLATGEPPTGPPPHAVVAPHAGYVYSGQVAGSAFRLVAPLATLRPRVVLLGPSHYVPFRGLALPTVDAFRTPLGNVPVDRAVCDRLSTLAGVIVDDRPHQREHSLEVELPFLQTVLDAFTLVPLAVGDATPDEVAAVIEAAIAAPGAAATLVVVSTDLSHYLDYELAARRDRATAAAVVALDERRIGDEDACGRHPLRGLLVVARRNGWRARCLDLRSSGDTAGPRDAVVGYGAFAFE